VTLIIYLAGVILTAASWNFWSFAAFCALTMASNSSSDGSVANCQAVGAKNGLAATALSLTVRSSNNRHIAADGKLIGRSASPEGLPRR